MNTFETFGLLAQAEPEGNGFLGLLIIVGVIWACYAIFGPKKDKYVVRRQTSVHKVD